MDDILHVSLYPLTSSCYLPLRPITPRPFKFDCRDDTHTHIHTNSLRRRITRSFFVDCFLLLLLQESLLHPSLSYVSSNAGRYMAVWLVIILLPTTFAAAVVPHSRAVLML